MPDQTECSPLKTSYTATIFCLYKYNYSTQPATRTEAIGHIKEDMDTEE